MKLIPTNLLAALLLFVTAAMPLQAQTDTPTPTNAATVQFSEKHAADIEKKRIEAEKDLESDRVRARQHVVHDLAWNSWVVLVIVALVLCYFKRKMQHETIRQMIDKGVPLTPELIRSVKAKGRRGQGGSGYLSQIDPQGYLSWSVILIAVGVGVLILCGKAGWIVLLIGVANLFLWALDSRKPNNG